MKVTAILASHNRRARTLECLASYYAQETRAAVALTAVLVDDGSIDETAQAVRKLFPQTEVIVGSGNLFWAGAMALAEQAALARDPDYLLWLNDDVVLDRDALSRLIQTAGHEQEGCIAVGALRDPATGELTYSGVRHRGLHPMHTELIAPEEEPAAVDTFNGNVVLVPFALAARVGAIDGAFAHGAADFDYGLRAGRLGIASMLAPGTVGTCPRGSGTLPWLGRSLSLRARLSAALGPKGIPPRSTARYLRRHGGAFWPVFWLGSYVKLAAIISRSAVARPSLGVQSTDDPEGVAGRHDVSRDFPGHDAPGANH